MSRGSDASSEVRGGSGRRRLDRSPARTPTKTGSRRLFAASRQGIAPVRLCGRADLSSQGPRVAATRRHDRRPPVERRRPRWGSLTIQSAIGRGAFATVYRAQDNLGRLVALKLFSLQPETAIDWAARLLHEGRLLARLRHENIVISLRRRSRRWLRRPVDGVRQGPHARRRVARARCASAPTRRSHVGRVLCRCARRRPRTRACCIAM